MLVYNIIDSMLTNKDLKNKESFADFILENKYSQKTILFGKWLKILIKLLSN